MRNIARSQHVKDATLFAGKSRAFCPRVYNSRQAWPAEKAVGLFRQLTGPAPPGAADKHQMIVGAGAALARGR
ncbi:MAG TPA: hypothetical protein VEH00_09915, partial [Steroidobacteraceae bacterium]|nr:hypothetical protein [Steroidobacteraceae bacterium]